MLEDELRFAIVHVLRDPARRRFLLGAGFGTLVNLVRFLRGPVPRARRALEHVERLAHGIPDEAMRREALQSIDTKAYHVAGAAILATFLPAGARDHYIEIVTPLESMYDYLDNLCDRHPGVTADAYPVLHQAIADALDPDGPLHDYYANGPAGDDGDYLRTLVERTRGALRRLHMHRALLPYFREAAVLYGEMQTYKHYPAEKREAACMAWYERHRERFGDLSWWEFACAAGSQFQVYAPLYAAFCSDAAQIEPAYHACFPSFAALHVLLDSFIDQREDREHGELNFAQCYDGPAPLRKRAAVFSRQSRNRFARLRTPQPYAFALRVMCLFYLTHPKLFSQGLDAEARALLEALS